MCVGFKETDFKIGSSKLFLRPDKLEELEKVLHMAKTFDGYFSLVGDIKQLIAERAEQKLKEQTQKHNTITNEILPSSDERAESTMKNVDSSSWHIVKSADDNGLVMKFQKMDNDAACSSINLGDVKPKKAEANLRYDKFDHFANHDGKLSASRCKYEKCNLKTHVYCVKCDVHLCFTTGRNCFFEFHHKA